MDASLMSSSHQTGISELDINTCLIETSQGILASIVSIKSITSEAISSAVSSSPSLMDIDISYKFLPRPSELCRSPLPNRYRCVSKS